MFRIIFLLCWQTENKICLVYVLDNVQRCKFQASSFKFELTAENISQNLSSSIDRELGFIDRESQKSDSIEFLN